MEAGFWRVSRGQVLASDGRMDAATPSNHGEESGVQTEAAAMQFTKGVIRFGATQHCLEGSSRNKLKRAAPRYLQSAFAQIRSEYRRFSFVQT